jgi:N-acetylmuramoyl-L-alanine amidase
VGLFLYIGGMAKQIVFLDAGHGGIDPNTGQYTTAPSKMFRFDPDQLEAHGDGYIYEGVLNRAICDFMAYHLRNLGILVFPVYDAVEDTALDTRVSMANAVFASMGPSDAGLFVSEHCNASRAHNASGFEIFTSPGNTKSDRAADFIYTQVGALVPSLRKRPDYSDGDADKEAFFKVLVETALPAVLIENGFMDFLKDAERLLNPSFLNLMAQAKAIGIFKYFATIK